MQCGQKTRTNRHPATTRPGTAVATTTATPWASPTTTPVPTERNRPAVRPHPGFLRATAPAGPATEAAVAREAAAVAQASAGQVAWADLAEAAAAHRSG